MNAKSSPDLGNRPQRPSIKTAPDEDVDPIETPIRPEPQPAARGTRKRAASRPRNAEDGENLTATNFQASDEVTQTLNFAKFKTGLSKRALIEQAILAHWGEYRPAKD